MVQQGRRWHIPQCTARPSLRRHRPAFAWRPRSCECTRTYEQAVCCGSHPLNSPHATHMSRPRPHGCTTACRSTVPTRSTTANLHPCRCPATALTRTCKRHAARMHLRGWHVPGSTASTTPPSLGCSNSCRALLAHDFSACSTAVAVSSRRMSFVSDGNTSRFHASSALVRTTGASNAGKQHTRSGAWKGKRACRSCAGHAVRVAPHVVSAAHASAVHS